MGYKDANRGAAAERRRALNKEMRRREAMSKQVERAEAHIQSCDHCTDFEDLPECDRVNHR